MAIDKFNLPFPKVNKFLWIVSPNKKPYKPYGVNCCQDHIEKGRSKYTHRLEKLMEVESGSFDDLFKSSWVD